MKLLTALAVVLGSLTFAGCSSSHPISEVLEEPARFSGMDVEVEGQVIQSYAILGHGAYRIEDPTGRLWVVAQGDDVPSQRAYVSVTGRLQQGYNLGGIIDLPQPLESAVVLMESSRETN